MSNNPYLDAIDRQDYIENLNDIDWIKRNTLIFNQPMFITHNKDKIMILGDGVWIVLCGDGTWYIEDTTGG